ncbi:MAG TPA: hypothetical protein VD789_10375 [Thermomicrobiales bacterium]|nr:hypothetical protein [Thermomicrobiales bacterium]
MTGRESVFSDPTIIQLASDQFIPVAENSSALERQQDDKGEFFRHVVEHGHYGGRTFPTATRQGSYTFLPDGTFLASINSRDPEQMAGMMREALARVERSDDLGEPSPVQLAETDVDADLYPADGLVLEATVRDLPRPDGTPTDGKWNIDYVWLRRDEARSLVPETLEAGQRREVPWPLVRRLARFHLRDYVRGEPFNWQESAIRNSELTTEVVEVSGSKVRLALSGSVRLQDDVEWVAPEDGETKRSDCGFDCVIRGEATWDVEREAFTAFDMVAAGDRWGTNQYNFRYDDLGPAPMGIAFGLAGSTPSERTAPHCLRTWRAPEPRSDRPSRVSVGPDEYFG